MASTATTANAAYKLERLDACRTRGIKPVQTDDSLVCANDQVGLVGRPLRHDPEEIRLLRTMAGDGWPK